jgi:hypothetical protein
MACRQTNKQQWAWIMVDAGSWGFCTVVTMTYMPLYFVHESRKHGVSANTSSTYWGYAVTAGMLFSAVFGPLIGCVTDRCHCKTKLLFILMVLSCVVANLCSVLPSSDWQGMLILSAVSQGMYNLFLPVYNAYLTQLAAPAEGAGATADFLSIVSAAAGASRPRPRPRPCPHMHPRSCPHPHPPPLQLRDVTPPPTAHRPPPTAHRALAGNLGSAAILAFCMWLEEGGGGGGGGGGQQGELSGSSNASSAPSPSSAPSSSASSMSGVDTRLVFAAAAAW